MNTDIDQAKQIIGAKEDDDYILRVGKHAESLKNDAPEFSKMLEQSGIVSVVKEYERSDEEAESYQKSFKWWSKNANWAVLLTSSFGALLVASPGIILIVCSTCDLKNDSSTLVAVLMTLSVVSSAWGTVCFTILKSKGLLTKWMESRAQAEESRLEYFNRIVGNSIPKGKDFRQILLRLEYFRRYQLDMQFSYYLNRGNDHEKSASILLTISAIAMGGVVLINSLAGAFGIESAHWTAIAALAIILQSVVITISNQESINQDQRNAERYRRTSSALNKLQGRLDEIRAAIANGKEDLLQIFVKAVHEVLSAEHRQWLANLEHKQTAINTLEIKLEELRKRKD